MRKFILLLFIPFLFIGCKKTDYAAIDAKTIQQYITDHNLTTAVAEPNGLYYVPTLVGTGAYPTINSTVTVNYKGYLTDGTLSDADRRQSYAPDSIRTRIWWSGYGRHTCQFRFDIRGGVGEFSLGVLDVSSIKMRSKNKS